MNEVTPAYYASGVAPVSFTLLGAGFSRWRDRNVYGFNSIDNGTPRMNAGQGITSRFAYDMEYISDSEVRFTQVNPSADEYARYLGVIEDVDGETRVELWVNETNPLP